MGLVHDLHTKHLTEDNTPEALKTLYNSTYVITRDELEDGMPPSPDKHHGY